MTKRCCFRFATIVLSCALAATQSGRCASSVDDSQSSRQAAGPDLPSGAIESMEQANAALDAVAKERTRADAQYKSRQSECYHKFFATPCLEGEKKLYQKHIAELEAIKLKADRFSRQERKRQVDERRRAGEEERARSAEQRTTASVQNPERTERAARQPPAPKQEKTARTASPDSKPRGAHTIRAVDDAETRRLNAEKYQQKEREAAERRERTAKTRAEKVAKRAQKAAKQRAQQEAQQQAQQGKKAASPSPADSESAPAPPSERRER